MFDLVIRGGSVVTGTSVEPLDIAVEDGVIRAAGSATSRRRARNWTRAA